MKSNIEKHIPEAIRVIEDVGIAENKVVKKEFKGYISSMGASIIQAGLLPTVAFYSYKGGAEANRPILLKAILRLIEPASNNDDLMNYMVDQTKKNGINRAEYTRHDLDLDKLFILEEKISDALIALKLALRTYKIVE